MSVIEEIAAERERQKTGEGWSLEHDNRHHKEQLAVAAVCYATPERLLQMSFFGTPILWPWSADWWKPKDRRRDLIRAGALIVAEIERIDRKSKMEKA